MDAAGRPGPTDVLPPERRSPIPLKLAVVAGPDFGAELALEVGTYRIGQDASNDLVLTDSAVSRVHLIVAVLDGALRVTDNGSTNGSFIGQQRFDSLEIGPSAEIRLGRSVLRVMVPTDRAGDLPPSENTRFGALVGQSLVMRQAFTRLERAAASDAIVLIQGETGTGKELCAEAIHAQSRRAQAPFVLCDLAAVSPSLFEAELFGHVKGAFSGAISDRSGPFERAHGGTIFLDEVGEVPLDMQPRLLRVLEKQQVKRVGASAYRSVDVRVIAATCKDLSAEVRAGRFRDDLYHRLVVLPVRLPPLRERLEDLPWLIDEILQQLGKEPSQLSAETRAMLLDYSWPGNVRELRNVIERAICIGPEGVPRSRSATRRAPALDQGENLPFKEAKERLVNAFEHDYLADLLRRCEGNISRASREAQIDRVHLRRLLRKHGIQAASSDVP